VSGGHFHRLRVADMRADADDAVVVTFEVPPALAETFRFVPGQSLTLRRFDGGDELRRSYSICSAPGEPLRVGVRRLAGGRFSGWLHAALKAGDTIDVMEPEGRFGAALAKRPRHVLAVAAGSGITPLLSITKAVLGGDPAARVTLLYGNRTAATTMFKEELEDLKNRHLGRLALHFVFSREHLEPALARGRLDAGKIAALMPLVRAGTVDEALVCGPHGFDEAAVAALQAAGIAAAHIHVERFGVPATPADAALHAPRPGDAALARVTVVRDGVTREVAFREGDESLLAAAERAGLDLPYSCRSGVCATCRARLLEGRVRMDRNFALEPADLDAGFVLTCQAHPLTERVVVSFDER